MNEYQERRKQEKETLDFVIKDILEQATKIDLPKLPSLIDFAENTNNKYVPKKYQITDFSIKNEIGCGEKYEAEICVTITKTDSSETYNSFFDYWTYAADKINNIDTSTGKRALLATELFRNFLEFYGNDSQNKDINKIIKSLHEIVTRLIRFNKVHDEDTITSIKLPGNKTAFVKNLYENLFANKKNIILLSKHDTQGKFENESLALKTKVQVEYV